MLDLSFGRRGFIVVSALVAFCLKGCSDSELADLIDSFSFRMTGGTVFADPGQLTIKEVHLDSGNLLGQMVIMNGKIASSGEFDTHAVLFDESGRMLVVLTRIDGAAELLNDDTIRELKILGTVERGKKGLPYIMARSVKSVDIAGF